MFAVSLRRKKHEEKLQSKRRQNFQKAFEQSLLSMQQAVNPNYDPQAENTVEITDIYQFKQIKECILLSSDYQI